MAWNDVTLSTSQSISRIEGEVASLLDPADKIALADKLIRRQVENLLASREYRVDESAGQSLLDLVGDPMVFDLASDYLVLHLIYSDLAVTMGREMHQSKAEFYHRQFETQFNAAVRAIRLDPNRDGHSEPFRADLFTVGKMTR
jgi:hypothetical protein